MPRTNSTHDRCQHKPTLHGDARIWFFLSEQVVYPQEVHTHHPKAMK